MEHIQKMIIFATENVTWLKKGGTTMNTVTIDSTLYKEAERFAAKNNMTMSSFFEYAVRKIITAMSSDTPTKTSHDTLKYQQALEYMNSFVADDLTEPVPADEKGIGALVEEKYLS